MVATWGRSRLDVTLLVAVGLGLTGVVGGIALGPHMMREGCFGSPETHTQIQLSELLHEYLPE